MKRILIEVKMVGHNYQATSRIDFPRVKGRGSSPAKAIIELMHLIGTQNMLWWFGGEKDKESEPGK